MPYIDYKIRKIQEDVEGGTLVEVRYFNGDYQDMVNPITGETESVYVRSDIIETVEYLFPLGVPISLNEEYRR